MPEIALLKYILIYNNYNKYYKYININKYNYKELNIIYNLISKFFDRFQRDTSIAEFTCFFFEQYPRLKPEEINAYQSIFTQAMESEIPDESLMSYVELARRRALALEFAEKSIAFSEGRTDGQDMEQAFEIWKRPEIIPDATQFITDSLEELKNETHSQTGLRWRLLSLNKALGSLRLGDFGFIFARPETGKTTFLASEITFMAEQINQPIIWFNNEEQGNKVKLRCFQAALGVNLEYLFSHIKEAQQEYEKLTKGNIKIYDSGTIFRSEVQRIIEEVKPALIIFDQIDKIKGFEADRNDLVMGSIYQWARGLAKEFAPVIGVCQSDGTGEGVKWLTMSHVAEAKTAKQSEADWILGIGKTNIDGFENVRHLHLSKNKLIGDIDSDPEWRHGRWDVIIEPQIARYRDI